jgi:hypothetical protein
MVFRLQSVPQKTRLVLGGVSHQAPVEEKSLSRHWLRRASLSFVALLFEMRS